MSLSKPWNAEELDPIHQIGKLFKYAKVRGSEIPRPLLKAMGYKDVPETVDTYTVSSMTGPSVLNVVPIV